MNRTDERALSKAVRRHLLTEPGIEATLRQQVAEDLAEDDQYQDEERELWRKGDTDRDH